MTRMPCFFYSQPPQPQAGIGLGTILTIYITCIINGFDRPWRAWRATSPQSSLAERSWGLEAQSARTGRPETNNLPLRDCLADIDILGIVLQVATTVLFAIAATFLRPGCAGATYAIMLYYMPLFYAFSKGLSALQQTVRLLPFVLPFIVTVVIIAACLPRVKHYGLIYLAGGAITLGSATALATTLAPNVSESKVMGLTALVGVGLGLHFQHSNAISNRIHKDLRDRIEGAALLNMSLMGGISMALIIAGAVYENRGMSLLKSALGSFDYDEGDLHEALAGVSRDTGGGDEAHSMIAYGANATCKAIALLFYIVASSGALCLACGVLAVFGRSRAKKSQ
uniref:Uncharacterized protein n=1 Tax=Fusarium oxysporum (strain Fo5176) TaxID=660025 RepID=A0A0D2YES8_FUSOF